jgi:hypothetical protein
VAAYGPLFHHLFGVSPDEVWSWPADRWDDYRRFADGWMQAQGWKG